MSMTDLTIAVLPCLDTMVLFLAIVTYWPGLSTRLPRVMGTM